MTEAISLQGVTKTFGEKVAVRDMNLVIPEGGLYGFIGPNGAGKTTTIRMIMSILFPDRGELSVLGNRSAMEAKDRIGYLPEERGLYKKMKVGRYLAYISRLKGKADAGVTGRVRKWLERIGLADVENKKCEELSKGMQQKIQFLAAVIHEPDLLILDEPFSGLDPVNQRLLRDLVLEQHRRGATVIFSTHVMTQAEQICENIVMINDGDKVLDETLAGIRSRFDPRTLLFEPLDDRSDAAALERVPGVQAAAPSNGGYEISVREGHEPAGVIREITASLATARIELHRPTLEDIFIRIVTGEDGAEADDLARLRAALREGAAAEDRR